MPRAPWAVDASSTGPGSHCRLGGGGGIRLSWSVSGFPRSKAGDLAVDAPDLPCSIVNPCTTCSSPPLFGFQLVELLNSIVRFLVS